MVFINGMGVFPKFCSFAIQSLIFIFWRIFFENDVTKNSHFSSRKNSFGEFSYKESKMVFKNGMGVFPKFCSFAIQSLIFIFWRILFKKDVKKKSIFRHKKIVSENSHIKSQSWSLKEVLASSLRSVVLQFSLWFFIFDVFFSKMTSQKKVIFRHTKIVSENSHIKSQSWSLKVVLASSSKQVEINKCFWNL